MAGPLRLYNIKEHAEQIEKRFAIMKYTNCYAVECSMVIVFNENGEYISQYSLASELYYEDYATKNVMTGGDHYGRRKSLQLFWWFKYFHAQYEPILY